MQCAVFETCMFTLLLRRRGVEITNTDSGDADMSGEQMSQEVKTFCNEIGTTLRALEEGTLWVNRAELYIGLLK